MIRLARLVIDVNVFGVVSSTQRAFDGMKVRTIVSWNSLITCCEQNDPVNKALEVFVERMNGLIEPDTVTLASVVSACASLLAIREGLQFHTHYEIGPLGSETLLLMDITVESGGKFFGGFCLQLLRSSQDMSNTIMVPIEVEVDRECLEKDPFSSQDFHNIFENIGGNLFFSTGFHLKKIACAGLDH